MLLRTSWVVLGSALVATVGCGDDSSTGTGGGGGGTSTTTSSTTTTSAVTTSASSTTGQGGATTGSGGAGGGPVCALNIDIPGLEACYVDNCCAQLDTCTQGGTDEQGCIDCLVRGSGDPRCNDLMICSVDAGCGDAVEICDSNVPSFGGPTVEACLTDSCCQEYTDCTEGGTNPSGCAACFLAGGGALCDAALACGSESCGVVNAPICNSGLSTGDPELSACISDQCCDEFNACTNDGTEVIACLECFNGGGGAQCDAARTCAEPCFGPIANICDSGIGIPNPDEDQVAFAACVSDACCAEANFCTSDGADADACIDCFVAGGGPLCDPFDTCAAINQCDPKGGYFCDSGVGLPGDFIAPLSECVSANCCTEANDCTSGGTDIAGCSDCLNTPGGGAACAALDACAVANCSSGVVIALICDSGLAYPGDAAATCLGTSCCAEANACSGDGADVGACLDCVNALGGALCDDLLACAADNCMLP